MNAATVEFHALRIFLSLVLWTATFASLGLRHSVAQANMPGVASASQRVDDPVHRSWEVGGFVAGGFPPYYEIHSGSLRYNEELDFYNAGAVAGIMLTAPRGPGFLRGRGEAVVEVTLSGLLIIQNKQSNSLWMLRTQPLFSTLTTKRFAIMVFRSHRSYSVGTSNTQSRNVSCLGFNLAQGSCGRRKTFRKERDLVETRAE